MQTKMRWGVRGTLLVLGAVVLADLASVAAKPQTVNPGAKATVEGTIQARDGDLVGIKQAKTGAMIIVVIGDATTIEREKSWGRRADMDVTAMVPGLTIKAEGVGDANGNLDAKTIRFNPDAFAIEVAQQKEIDANAAAAAQAQKTANKGVAKADAAQASADIAQVSADVAQATAMKAGATAQAAGTLAVADAAAIGMVNRRVSDLGDYKLIGEGSLYFGSGQAALSDADKQILTDLATAAKELNNYLIEIAGYASSTGTKSENQKLSEERAAAVAQFLRNSASVPMRRIIAPAGYGATHAAATNADSQGRELNRRVDVKVLVNKGLAENL
jgi:outer membrane protein OmpA-like peptidoglycan-associated protein